MAPQPSILECPPAGAGPLALRPERGRLADGRLRIAQVITRMVPGGASRIVLDIMASAPEGWEMELFTGPEGLPRDLPADLPERSGLQVIPDLVREISPLRDWRALRALTAALARGRFDVVHAHTSKAGILARIAASRAGVRRIIYSTHGSIFQPGSLIPGVSGSRLRRRLLLAAERYAGRRTHVLTTLSLQEKDTSIGLGLADPGRIHTVYNGIDLARFAPDEGRRSARRALWRLRADDILLVAAGRLSPEKGHGDLLEAAIRLRQEHPRLKVAICGEGPLAAELARSGGRCTAPGAILLPGLVKDMPSVLAAADIFVHPALYEGFGLACLEAMAAGLPVVATRVGGLPELVRHGQDGYLVPPGDRDALAAALRLLLGSPGRRAWMGRKARLHAGSFGRQRMLAAYHDLYRGAAGGPPQG